MNLMRATSRGHSALQSFWLHFLGKKALVQKEEDPLATRNSGRSADRNWSCGWYRISCYDNRSVMSKNYARAYKYIEIVIQKKKTKKNTCERISLFKVYLFGWARNCTRNTRKPTSTRETLSSLAELLLR